MSAAHSSPAQPPVPVRASRARAVVCRARGPAHALAPPARHSRVAETSSAAPAPPAPTPARSGAAATRFVSLGLTAGAAVAVISLARSLERTSEAWRAVAEDASRASRELERLASAASASLPEAMDAVEKSANEVEALASETREALTKLDGSEYVENLKAEIEARMKNPTKDFRDLSDDVSEYVKRLTLELGTVMQTVGIYLDDGTFDDDAAGLSVEEKLIRRRSITEAVQAAKETTESAAALTNKIVQNGGKTKGRDLAEIVGKIALASEEVSKAMSRVVEATSSGGFGRTTLDEKK